MIRSKRQMYMVIGAFVLVMLLGTATYAFFNYTRTGTQNTIRTGRIAFNSTQGTAINLTNVFPVDVSNGIPNNNANVGSVTINVTGDTTYGEGIEYLVSAVNVSNTVNNKSLPISIDVSVTSNTENDPATTLGTSDDSYFTDRGHTTSYYKVLAGNTINTNDQLLVGYIAPGATGVDGNLVIRAYIDKAKVAISDTYPEGDVTHTEGEEPNQETITDYTNGTTSTWVGNRTVFTTSEWNSLQTNGISFQVKVVANEGIWVPNPGSANMSLSLSSGNITEGESMQVTITPNDNGTLSCLSSDTTVATCSITGTTLTVSGVSAGSATITVSQTAGSGYATASTVTYTANIKATSTMSLSSNSGTITEGESTTVTITTTGDGTLSCTSSTANATCSIAGTTLTISGVSVGSAVITVSQTAGPLHLAPSDVTYTATINPSTVTITYNANGGTISPSSKTIQSSSATYGELATPNPPSGYKFDGWYTAANGGTKVESSTAFVNGTSVTTLYAHYSLIPTIASCPGCKFMYTTSWYQYGGASNANATQVSTLTGVTEDYTTLNKNYFIGFTETQDGKIDRAFACGIKGTDNNGNINQGTAFCIEGVLGDSLGGNATTRANVFASNTSLITGSTLWNDSDGTAGRCTISSYYVNCIGSVGALAYSGGRAVVSSGDSRCSVDSNGGLCCYE